MESTPLRVPEGLGPSGKELYESLAANTKITAAHRALILNAARMADRLDALTEEVGDRLTTTNSQGTETINPLISEHRMITTALLQILHKLGVGEMPKSASGPSLEDQLAKQREKRLAKKASAQ